MANMSIRFTCALDPQTAENIKRLARSWGVSQAEVIRRAARQAAEREAAPKLSPADVVAHYTNQPLPRDRAETQRLIKSMRRLRHEDGARRGDDAKS
ncbi:MAG: ribbon-helix-helix protein, CopG family [Gammaproteobacteria bacterium]